MSAATHTKGFWEAHDDGLITAGPNKLHIAQVAMVGMGFEGPANAKLMAASPRMLAALREFVETMEALPKSDETSVLVWDAYHAAKSAMELAQ